MIGTGRHTVIGTRGKKPKIVISYRREDTAGASGRIYDRLCKHYGNDAVFRDIDKMHFGLNFHKQIEEALMGADAMVCIIGEKWLGKSPSGGSRISDPKDYVRLELEVALQRDIPILPVLIDRTPMPSSTEVPESIHGLLFRHAMNVDQLQDFDVHTKRLIEGLDQTLAYQAAAGRASRQEDAKQPLRRGARLLVYSVLGVLIALMLVGLFAPGPRRVPVPLDVLTPR